MKKLCKNCNKEFDTHRNSKQHCSAECFKQYRLKPEVIEESKRKRKEYNLKKYGVDNPAKLKEIKEKSKQTCLEKYGVASPTLVKEIHDKQIKTCLKKYGVKNPQQNRKIQQKQQKTLFKNYGVIIPLQNKQIKEKATQTCLERYGVDNVAKFNETKEKAKQTCLKKYGTESPSQNEEIRNKQIKTCLINHNTKTPQENFLIKEKSRIQRKKLYYFKLFNTDRLKRLVKPLMTELDYINTKHGNNLKFQCNRCDNVFEDNLKSGNIPRCQICYPIHQSKLQTEIIEYIKFLDSSIIIYENDRKTLTPLELDIYIPSKKLAIEFNGLYWHSEIGGKKYKNYHLNKTNKCIEKEIKLIHIFEDEWIEKPEIVKNRLKYILGKNKEKSIYARNCEIKEIFSSEANNFLEKYHLQGEDRSSIQLGAFYNNVLVSVMTFGKLRLALGFKKLKENEYEIYRFCVNDKNIIGVGGKLFNYFIKKYNPSKIISYADKRWSNNNAFYTKIGMKLVSETMPNYWYVGNNYMHRYYRFNFRKSELHKKLENFDPNLTEWENMQLNGYDRIWDCGNLKYEWVKLTLVNKPKIQIYL